MIATLLKRIGATALCLALCLGVTGCLDELTGSDSSSIDFGDNNPEKVVCMGDSITEGGNGESGPPWPSILAAITGKITINEGNGGELSNEGSERIGGVLSREKPGWVVIFYGANDAIFGFGEDYFVNQIQQMIDAARANKTEPIVCTVLPTYGARAFANDRTIRYSDRLRQLTSEQGVRLADVRASFEGRPDLMLDGLHPTDEGLNIIADIVAGQID